MTLLTRFNGLHNLYQRFTSYEEFPLGYPTKKRMVFTIREKMMLFFWVNERDLQTTNPAPIFQKRASIHRACVEKLNIDADDQFMDSLLDKDQSKLFQFFKISPSCKDFVFKALISARNNYRSSQSYCWIIIR
jgi:hypothetical protein